MLFDWFTVAAQVFNFLVLVWLLQHFLYKPILHAIDEREKRVAAEIANADRKTADAKKESDELKQQKRELDNQRAAILTRATEEANAEREHILDNARKAATALTAKQRDTFQQEEENLHVSINNRTRQEVFAIARKTLTDLSETSLEERMVGVLMRKLQNLAEEEKESLIAAFKATDNPVIVHTAFDIPVSQRSTVESAVKDLAGKELQVRFATKPNLISGIEMTVDGQKVAWSIADYLTSLDARVNEIVQGADSHGA